MAQQNWLLPNNFKPFPTAEKEKCQELYSFEVLDVFF
jgi:hypothetical protein